MHPNQTMAFISNPNLSLTAFALFLTLATTLVHSQNDNDSIALDSFPTDPFQDDIIYQFGAHVPEGSKFLRLTDTDEEGKLISSSIGRVLYTWAVNFWEESPARQVSFETTINFRITPSEEGEAAEGLAFFISPQQTLFDINSAGGNLGIFNGSDSGTAPSVVVVEFDTFVNSEWDPSYRHIGIDIESRVSKNTTEFDSATGEVVTARISYDSKAKVVSVVATSGEKTASVSYAIDLKTVLPEEVEMGISSATGRTVSEIGVHDVISWYFNATLVDDSSDDTYIRQYV